MCNRAGVFLARPQRIAAWRPLDQTAPAAEGSDRRSEDGIGQGGRIDRPGTLQLEMPNMETRWLGRGGSLAAAVLFAAVGCIDVNPTQRHDVAVTVYGRGQVLLDPPGGRYPDGTQVTLMAVDDGDGFSFWGQGLSGDDPIRHITVHEDISILALFESAPRPSATHDGPFLLAHDGTFLGLITDNPFIANGIASPLGPYGDVESATCIWNPLSEYGADSGDLSPFPPEADTPPLIIADAAFVAFCTTNTGLAPRHDPNDLARDVDRQEVARD